MLLKQVGGSPSSTVRPYGVQSSERVHAHDHEQVRVHSIGGTGWRVAYRPRGQMGICVVGGRRVRAF